MDWFAFISEQWMLVGLLALLAGAFFWNEGRRGGQTLSHSEMTRLLNADQAVLLDLRDAAEYKAGHAKVEQRVNELEKHRAKTLVLVDKMGQHTGTIGRNLREKGYTVCRLQGGMAEWNGQNLPVVKG